MSGFKLVWPLALLLVACGGAQPAPEAAPVTPELRSLGTPAAALPRAPEARPKQAASAAPSADPLLAPRTDAPKEVPAEPAPISNLPRVVCTISSNGQGRWARDLPLRLAQGDAPFAYATATSAQLSFGDQVSKHGARFEGHGDGFELRAVVAPPGVFLRPARGQKLGIISPKPGAEFEWLGISAQSELEVGYTTTFPLRAKLSFGVPCAGMGLDLNKFDARKAAGLGKPTGKAYLAHEHNVTLSAQPDGSQAVELMVNSAVDVAVEVHRKQGKRTLIAVDQPDEIVVGWVESALLLPKPDAQAGRGSGFGTGKGIAHTPRESRVCDDAVRLFASSKTTQARVGSIQAGTPIRIRRFDSVYANVLPPAWLVLTGGGKLLVPAAELVNCRPS